VHKLSCVWAGHERGGQNPDRTWAARHGPAEAADGQAQLRLQLLDPRLVLQRGYAWLADMHGQPLVGALAIQTEAVQTYRCDSEVGDRSRPRLI
jgi:hypothetical protein